MNEQKFSNALNTMDANTLMNTALPPVRFIVDELIPQGLHVLAGAPKVGKSYLTLWLCFNVARGEPIWELPSRACGTLYISLEDTPERIKKRLGEMTVECPTNMHLSVCAGNLDDGLLEQLEHFIREHPDIGFIAIDTLQKVRSQATSGQGNPYAADYNALSALKKFADSHKIALLLVHHLRKAKSDDPFERISGTTGITGAVDTSYVLTVGKQRGKSATLYATGRDIAYQELDLFFMSGVWHLTEHRKGDENDDDSPSELATKIIDLVCERRGWKGTPSELVFLLEEDAPAHMITKLIKREEEELSRAGVSLRCTRSNGHRFIHFNLDAEKYKEFLRLKEDGRKTLVQAKKEGYELSEEELGLIGCCKPKLRNKPRLSLVPPIQNPHPDEN